MAKGSVPAPPHPREIERLKALRETALLDTSPSEAWDNLARIAAAVCRTPIALISMVDEDRQWFKARVGLEPRETHRDHAFCAYAILQQEIFTVKDASTDPRFQFNPLVTGTPEIRFYAGMPVRAPDGSPLGTVCVIDDEARELDEHQQAALKGLAKQAEFLVRSRSALMAAEALLAGTEDAKQTAMNAASDVLLNPLTAALMQLTNLRNAVPGEAERIDKIDHNLRRAADRVKAAIASSLDDSR